jgi:arylsulfatase A-like enzyme
LTGAATLSSILPIPGIRPDNLFAEQPGIKKKPNLLFIFSDQHSRDMVGCYGNRDLLTINLDNFAGEGVKFENCISSSPLCTPFRGMLMSGQHSLYNGAVYNDVPLLANNGKYFGHVLQDAGYKMGYIGKWHLYGGERNRPIPPGKMRYGFDGTFLSDNCHVGFKPNECYYWNDKGEKVFFDEWEVFGQTNQALEFLDSYSADSGEPFALFISWHPPHDWGIHPESMVFQYDTIPELMNLYNPEKIHLRPNVEDNPAVRRAYQGYYGMISGVDTAFGWLIEKLRKKGLEDNTLVVFTSDHGDNLHSHNYTIAKEHPEDTSSRVPLLMRFPNRLPKNKSSRLLINPMDIMPTILGLLGLDIPRTVQGQNLSYPILKSNDDFVESVPLFFLNPAWRGVYTHRYTYAYGTVEQFTYSNDGKLALKNSPMRVLYDRANDPHQLKNLYGQRDAALLQNEMERLTKKWLKHFDDPGAELSFEDLNRLYSYNDGHFPEDTEEQGFRGRPIDIIKKNYKTKS